MGDEQHGQAVALPDPGQQFLHVMAGQRVERAEGLVHQQHLGPVGQARGRWRRAASCRRRARSDRRSAKLVSPTRARCSRGDLAGLGGRPPGGLERELDIALRGQPGQQRVGSGRRRRGRGPGPATGCPSTATIACVDGPRSPATMDEQACDLPQPDVPTSETNSLSPTSRSTPSSATTSPRSPRSVLPRPRYASLRRHRRTLEVAEQATAERLHRLVGGEAEQPSTRM